MASKLYQIKVTSTQKNFRLPKAPGQPQRYTDVWTFLQLGTGDTENAREADAQRKVLKAIWPTKQLAQRFCKAIDTLPVDPAKLKHLDPNMVGIGRAGFN